MGLILTLEYSITSYSCPFGCCTVHLLKKEGEEDFRSLTNVEVEGGVEAVREAVREMLEGEGVTDPSEQAALIEVAVSNYNKRETLGDFNEVLDLESLVDDLPEGDAHTVH